MLIDDEGVTAWGGNVSVLFPKKASNLVARTAGVPGAKVVTGGISAGLSKAGVQPPAFPVSRADRGRHVWVVAGVCLAVGRPSSSLV